MYSESDPAIKAPSPPGELALGMILWEYQGEGKAFATPVDVPTEAAPLERLIGLSGRDPRGSLPLARE